MVDRQLWWMAYQTEKEIVGGFCNMIRNQDRGHPFMTYTRRSSTPCGHPHRELKLEPTVFFSCKEVGVFF